MLDENEVVHRQTTERRSPERCPHARVEQTINAPRTAIAVKLPRHQPSDIPRQSLSHHTTFDKTIIPEHSYQNSELDDQFLSNLSQATAQYSTCSSLIGPNMATFACNSFRLHWHIRCPSLIAEDEHRALKLSSWHIKPPMRMMSSEKELTSGEIGPVNEGQCGLRMPGRT